MIYDELMRSMTMTTVPPNAPLLMAEEARTGGGTADLIQFDDYLRNNYTLSQLSELANNAKFLHERAALIAAEFEREGPRTGSPATEPAHAYAPPLQPVRTMMSAELPTPNVTTVTESGYPPVELSYPPAQEPVETPGQAGESDGLGPA